MTTSSQSPIPRSLFLSLVAIALAACSPRIDTHGFMPHPERLAEIEPGKQDKFAVEQILGSPSAVGTFDADQWYYITQQTQSFAFFKPIIIDQTVLVIAFDDTGKVTELHTYTLEDGRIVDPVTRKTPTVGKELTILQQLFGNVGRFTK